MAPGSAFGGAVDLQQYMASKQATPGADDMTKTIDILDSEVLQIEKVINILKERSRTRRNYDDFQREIKERFAEIGFVVDVAWYETNQADVKMPEIVIKGRTEAKAFDRERMTAEVTGDVLGFGEGGVIATDKEKVAAMLDGSYKGQISDVGHKH